MTIIITITSNKFPSYSIALSIFLRSGFQFKYRLIIFLYVRRGKEKQREKKKKNSLEMKNNFNIAEEKKFYGK